MLVNALLLAAVVAGAQPSPPPAPAAPPVEVASKEPFEVRVLQGDLLWISGQRIRLAGIAALDRAQRCDVGRGFVSCGAQGGDVLRRATGGGNVRCQIVGKEASAFVRDPAIWIGRCTGLGGDLARVVVAAGYAVPSLDGEYYHDGVQACAQRRGIWGASVESPVTYRRRRAGDPIKPIFVGTRSGTSCLRAMEGSRLR